MQNNHSFYKKKTILFLSKTKLQVHVSFSHAGSSDLRVISCYFI